MAIFAPKPWVNPFEKISIFRLFELLVFKAQKDVFFVLEYRKRHFPGLYCLKKKNLEKWSFLNQNHGLTPLEKCQFFDFLNFLLLQPRKVFFFCSRISSRRFFVLEYCKRHLSGLYCLKIKHLEKWPFQSQNHGLTPLEISQFFDFFNFLFLQPTQAFFPARIS